MKNFNFYLPLLLASLFIASCDIDVDPQLDAKVAVNFIDLAYGDDPRQRMDVYLPAGRSANSTRVFIWVHGGSWSNGDKAEFRQFKPWLEAAQEDYAYIALNYRLFDISSGRNSFPAQEEDLKTAISFIKSELDTWKVSDQVVLAGASAGGHLVLLHSYKNNVIGLVKAVVAFFPPTEIKEFFEFNTLTKLLFTSLIGGTPQQNPAPYEASSPLNFVSSSSVPTVFFHGEFDEVVPIQQSYLLEARLKELNVPFLREYLPNQGHGFSEMIYNDLIRKTAVFLDEQLP